MKQKSKALQIKKFTVAKLNDTRHVTGGGTTDNDGTDQDLAHPNCVGKSKIIITK